MTLKNAGDCSRCMKTDAGDYNRCVKTNASDYRDFSMFWSAVAVSWHSGASTE